MRFINQTRGVLGRLLPLGVVLGLFLLPVLRGNTTAVSTPSVAGNKYIGSKKCQNCHKAEASGDQWGAWQHASHSKARAVLSSDAAKKIAAELGIPDAAKSDDCLKCHVTAFEVPAKQFKKSFDRSSEAVGCESCHGPGNDHARARFRAANEVDDEDGFGDEEEAAFSEIPEGEIGMGITRELCVKCHNDASPTYKPFCFFERAAKVRHLNPLKPRTPEQRAAMLVCGCGDACGVDHECTEACGVPPK